MSYDAFLGYTVILCMAQTEHMFDFWALVQQVEAGFYERIKLVNYYRHQVLRACISCVVLLKIVLFEDAPPVLSSVQPAARQQVCVHVCAYLNLLHLSESNSQVDAARAHGSVHAHVCDQRAFILEQS